MTCCTQLEVMVKRQACVANLFSWAPAKQGGKALEVLLCALQSRWPHKLLTSVEVNWEICKVTCKIRDNPHALD